jgi:hypothetical protein
MVLVVSDFAARAKRIQFFRKKFLHFCRRRLIIRVGGLLLVVPLLGQNRFLTTKSDFL